MDIFAPRHLILILLIALVVFGTKKIRTIGSDLGGAVRGFKDGMKGEERDAESAATAMSTLTVASNVDTANMHVAKAGEKV